MRGAAANGFRPDLEGLRGIAILLVLLFHANMPFTTGGFVGVDVFFVLSGFLITGLLFREHERSGRIDLRAFYARRARRILPAALVILVVILAFSWFTLAPLDLPRVSADAAAAALSVGNVRFALAGMDYFAQAQTPSPVLHYWSLGVEEQFYLVWPALLILATRSRRPRAAAVVVLLAVVVLSYGGSLFLTDSAPAWAFYSLPTRAWQLGLGGLLALTAVWYRRLPDLLVAPIGWIGLVAVLASLFFIRPSTSYPGVAALLPGLGSAGVILAGERRASVGRLLSIPPLRFLGLISFSLYLVHWPILVLPAAYLPLGGELPFLVRVGLGLIAIVLGWVSYQLIEEPFRRRRRLRIAPGRTLAVAGLAVALTVSICFGASLASAASLESLVGVGEVNKTPSPPSTPTATATATASEAASPQASPTGSSSAASSPTATPSPTPRVAPTGPQPLPADVRPPLAGSPGDAESLEADGCLLGQPQVDLPDCAYGDPNGATTVAVVGDSHAAHWFPALEPIAKANGWRLVPFIKLSCRFIDMSVFSYWYGRMYTECDTWRQRVVERLKALQPSLVIVSVIRDLETSSATDSDPAHQGAAMARLLQQVPGRKVIIVDTPSSEFDVPSCLSRHVADVRGCETPRSKALGAFPGVVERTAARAIGATLVDLTPQICPWDPCPVVLDGMIVYRDNHHLTATFSASLQGPLAGQLQPVLVPGGASPSATP